jgi:hypothetical protein
MQQQTHLTDAFLNKLKTVELKTVYIPTRQKCLALFLSSKANCAISACYRFRLTSGLKVVPTPNRSPVSFSRRVISWSS